MDWDNDYYTFSDTNIEYIWRFLKAVHERGWLYKGHRSTQWCPAAARRSPNTSRPAKRTTELEHPSLYVRFPPKGREGESLVVWTTTPWTLPANVAAAVKPDAEYGLRDGHWMLAEEKGEYDHVTRGEELVGLEYEGPYDAMPAAVKEHRVIPWDEVSLTEGTGIVHIALGAGTEDFELGGFTTAGGRPDRRVRADAAGFGFWKASTDEVEDAEDLRERELLVESGRITHRYPICWRCKTPLVFRVVDDWFISARRSGRAPRRERDGRVDAVLLLEADGRLAAQHGRLEHLAQAVLRAPPPFYPCDCGELNVVGSRAGAQERATAGLDQLLELHRPWIDEVPISCGSCGKEVRRIPRSATPGSTPASCPSRHSDGRTRSGFRPATPPARRRGSRCRPARPRVLGALVPGALDL